MKHPHLKKSQKTFQDTHTNSHLHTLSLSSCSLRSCPTPTHQTKRATRSFCFPGGNICYYPARFQLCSSDHGSLVQHTIIPGPLKHTHISHLLCLSNSKCHQLIFTDCVMQFHSGADEDIWQQALNTSKHAARPTFVSPTGKQTG